MFFTSAMLWSWMVIHALGAGRSLTVLLYALNAICVVVGTP